MSSTVTMPSVPPKLSVTTARLCLDAGEDLRVAAFDVQRREIDPRREHVFDRDVPELQRGGDQLPLLLVEAALLGHVLDDVIELVLGDGLLRVAGGMAGRRLPQRGQNPAERAEKAHEKHQRAGGRQGQLVRELLGDALGQHLAREKDHDRGDERADGNRAQAPAARDRERDKGGGGNMYDIGADQNRGDRLVEVVEHIEGLSGPGVPPLLGEPDTRTRARGERRLGRGEVHRAEQQQYGIEKRQSTAILHSGFSISLG